MGTSTPELKHRRSGDESNTGDHLGLLTPRYGHVHSPGFKHLDGVSLPPVRGGGTHSITLTQLAGQVLSTLDNWGTMLTLRQVQNDRMVLADQLTRAKQVLQRLHLRFAFSSKYLETLQF